MSDEQIIALETRVAELLVTVEDLSDVVARQGREIDVLTRRVHMLMERAAEQEFETGGSVPLADQKPPHW